MCSEFAGESRCGGVISTELHMQLCGDHSSAWLFSCGFCFASTEHFFWGGLLPMGVCFCLNIFLLVTQFLSITLLTQVTVIVIMFLWKPFDHFLLTASFYLHVKNILNLKSFYYCFLYINHWFSYIFSGLSKSSHLSLFIYPC